MSYRDQLIAVQRRVLSAIKRDIRSTLGKQPADLERYYRAYKRRFSQAMEPISREELIGACDRADIILVGDYHTLAQAQRIPIQLITALWEEGWRDWTLGLEMLQVSDQTSCDRYLAGEIDDDTFLREIDYEETWGFEWKNFRPLFDFARERDIHIFGINCDLQVRRTSLEERDTCAAMAIVQESLQRPDAKMLVLDGDMHVASPHLPRRIDAMLHTAGAERSILSVYQNSETLHWRLVKMGREQEVDIVQLSPREICIQHTHPIAKLQSYLNWLEAEEELDPVFSDDWFEDDAAEPDHRVQVQRFIDSIAETLGFEDEDLTDFQVYTVDDLNFLDDLAGVHVYSNEEIGLVAIQILKGESHFLPDGHMIYLGNLTVTHAAEEAAHYINFKLSGPAPRVESRTDDFYHRTMRETLGFLGSKIVNPSRLAYRAADYREIEQELRGKRLDVKGRDLRKIARAVLHHIAVETEFLESGEPPPRRVPKSHWGELSVFLGVVHALGYRLGLWLYSGLEQGTVSRDEVRDLFRLPFDKRGSAQQTYFDLLQRLQGVTVPYERRRERF